MTTWPAHATWTGPIVMIGFGSIGRGTLPLILRHIGGDASRITVIDPDSSWRGLAEQQGATFRQESLTRKNFKRILKPLLSAGPGQAFVVNLSVDVDSVDVMRLARQTGSLYIDTVIEPWPGIYYNTRIDNGARTNYMLRERMLKLQAELGLGVTAVSCCGANPGMVSWFVKQALLDVAAATKVKVSEPVDREGWARLMQRLRVKGVHIAERDTQRARNPKPLDTFINTWSVEGFISEGLQPAELGWGTHEKTMPADGRRHKTGCGAAIYLDRPGAETRVRTWVPTSGPQYGFLVTHNEAISIADYYTVRDGRKVVYRPTSHYAYHPSNDAVLSMHELFGSGGKRPAKTHILDENEIVDGMDELGVLLYGHRKNAYWFGSQLRIEDARRLAPYQSATGLQVTSAVLAGMVWAIENPRAGIVETEAMDHRRCLDIQSSYLGKLTGVFTDWTPLDSHVGLFDTVADAKDPWQFSNIIVR